MTGQAAHGLVQSPARRLGRGDSRSWLRAAMVQRQSLSVDGTLGGRLRAVSSSDDTGGAKPWVALTLSPRLTPPGVPQIVRLPSPASLSRSR